jgi:polysaccharide transporter, PST family
VRAVRQKFLQSKITHNAASLYVVQACRKLLPLFVLPYLARVLGPAGWGNVAFAQGVGEFIAIFVEFGFALSATRDLAQSKGSKGECGRIAVGTFGAQVVLATIGVLVALVVSTQVPLLRSHPRLLCAGLVYGVAQGMTPTWLFQGLERMTLGAVLEISSKVVALGAIFLFVHSPSDEWKVLAFQSMAPVVSVLAGLWVAHRYLTLYLPTFDMVWESIRVGWKMFLLRSGLATYSTANVLILAMFAPASMVGYYAAAEKLSKAIVGLLMPIRDAFYPRLSQLAAHSVKESQRLTRISAYIEVGCGFMLSLATFAGAHLIVRMAFGRTFESAVPILQILSLLPFITSLTDAIGLQSLLPAGKESLVTLAILAGGAVNLAFGVVLAPRFMAKGMAVSVVFAEVAVCTVLVCIVARTTALFSKEALHRPEEQAFASTGVEAATRTGK